MFHSVGALVSEGCSEFVGCEFESDVVVLHPENRSVTKVKSNTNDFIMYLSIRVVMTVRLQ